MARKLNGLAQRYVAALRKHLKEGPRAIPLRGTAQDWDAGPWPWVWRRWISPGSTSRR